MTRSTGDIYEDLLVLRCQRGDVEAWDELVLRYNQRLFYYVRRLVDDDDHAAQVLQETWLQVLRGLGALRQADRVAPWLYTIARRAVMSHFRERYSAPASTAEVPLDQLVDNEPLETAQFENAELVHFGLSQIGWIEREVLTLFFLEDLSIAEIARVLNIPPGTVKSRLSRARSELRRVLEQQSRADAGQEPSHAR